MPRYSENASQYHRKVGEILTTSPEFKYHKIFQEYPVKKINPDWHSNRHRFDWVIADLFLVIEVMGESHHSPQRFSNDVSVEQAKANLESSQFNDFNKKEAALSVGWRYLAIHYWEIDSLTAEKLLTKIALLPPPCATITTQKKEEKDTEKRKRYLEFARQVRKEQYQRFKAWKKEQQRRKQNEESDES